MEQNGGGITYPNYRIYEVTAGGLKLVKTYGIVGGKHYSSIDEAESDITLYKERRRKYYKRYNLKLVPMQFAIQLYTDKYNAVIDKIINI